MLFWVLHLAVIDLWVSFSNIYKEPKMLPEANRKVYIIQLLLQFIVLLTIENKWIRLFERRRLLNRFRFWLAAVLEKMQFRFHEKSELECFSSFARVFSWAWSKNILSFPKSWVIFLGWFLLVLIHLDVFDNWEYRWMILHGCLFRCGWFFLSKVLEIDLFLRKW